MGGAEAIGGMSLEGPRTAEEEEEEGGRGGPELWRRRRRAG
jgi:hypothetical protein